MNKFMALIQLFGVFVFAAGVSIVIYYSIPLTDGCHESPQNHRIVCPAQPIGK